MKNEFQSTRTNFAQSATFKAIVIGVLILIMLIPISLIRNLIHERDAAGALVKAEVSSKWGERQTLTGPVICIPYRYKANDGNTTRELREMAYFLPEELTIESALEPEIRYRSIYKVVVYQSSIKATGTFNRPDFDKLNINPTSIEWENCRLILGISDLKGICSNIDFQWDGTLLESMSGINESYLAKSGVTIKVPLSTNDSDTQTYSFDFSFSLNGSEGLFFVPVGKTTHVKMSSSWDAPSFVGAFLPDTRDISAENGFTAAWNILSYNRNYPQMWTGGAYQITSTEFGVNLILPVDHYLKTERSVKYAIMFIALTFLIFFLVELISRKKIHPFQYLLVSIGLMIFYCLLLSLSEYMHFNLAYLFSAIAIISLITSYSFTIFKSKTETVSMGCFLVALYLFLFTILQLEELALLVGSIGLFVALATVMYFSRKVEW